MNEEEKTRQIALFSKLFRELEAEIGTRDLARMVVSSLGNSISHIKVDNAKEFCEQFSNLCEVVSNTEPKFGILNYHFAKLRKEFDTQFCSGNIKEKKWKKYAGNQVKRITRAGKKRKCKILENATKLDIEGKTILIHDHSHTVQDVLINFKKKGYKFSVVIAEQDFEKTYGNIEKMHKAKIPFQVVL